MMSRGLSQRRACELLGLSRSSFGYLAAPKRNDALTARLKELAADEPRLGCRMAWARLRSEFAPLNIKRVRRIWKAEGLNLRPKKSRRLRGVVKTELLAKHPGDVWCLDFCHDSCAGGSHFKCLAVVDEASRECLVLEVARRMPAEAVVDTLRAAFAEYGAPKHLRSDNGPEFTAWALRLFLEAEGVKHLLIEPGSPWQNGFAESFVGTFRSECLDAEIFHNLADAQFKTAQWRRFYNEERPHSSLNYIQPSVFRRKWQEVKSTSEGNVV